MFRWKLLHYILPSKEMLTIWKITDSNSCNFCNQKEDNEHLFLKCPYKKEVWEYIYVLLEKIHLGKHIITMKNVVIGYKTNDQAYHEINLLLTIILFYL